MENKINIISEFIDNEFNQVLNLKKISAELKTDEFYFIIKNNFDKISLGFDDLRVPRHKYQRFAVADKDYQITFHNIEYQNSRICMDFGIPTYEYKEPVKLVATEIGGFGWGEYVSEYTQIGGNTRIGCNLDNAKRELKQYKNSYLKDIENHIYRNTLFINSQ